MSQYSLYLEKRCMIVESGGIIPSGTQTCCDNPIPS